MPLVVIVLEIHSFGCWLVRSVVEKCRGWLLDCRKDGRFVHEFIRGSGCTMLCREQQQAKTRDWLPIRLSNNMMIDRTVLLYSRYGMTSLMRTYTSITCDEAKRVGWRWRNIQFHCCQAAPPYSSLPRDDVQHHTRGAYDKL